MPNIDNMSDADVTSLIDKMCTARKNNPELQLMDSIQQAPYTEAQERYEIEQDEQEITNGIIKNICEDPNLTIEEINELKAAGIYDRYINKNAKEEKDDMAAIEAEIMASLAEEDDEEVITEVISETEEVTFQKANTTDIPTVEAEVVSAPEETAETEVTAEQIIENFKETPKTPKNKAIMNAVFGLPAAVAAANEGESYTETAVAQEEENPDLDLPATDLEVSDDAIIKNLTNKYKDVSDADALQLISVMNRYKAGEKFNVFEALPAPIKREILASASSVGADRSVINFFAKEFINSLVNDTYIDNEIADFNAKLKEVMAPMNNIVGTMMDEYSDDIYDKFTTGLLDKADQIQAENSEKAEQLRTIAEKFKAACQLTAVVDEITNNPGFINRAYKTARDRWNDMQYEYADTIKACKPQPKPLADCLRGLLAIGVPEEYAKTIIYFVKKHITSAIEEKTLDNHIYAYYMSNSIACLAYSAQNSKTFKFTKSAIDSCMIAIDNQMEAVRNRKSSKKNKRKK